MVSEASGKVLPTHERKSRKPLIERRRRQKFNNYLEEMKELVLEALHKDSNQYGKMEKADILEMTANYLKALRRQMSQQSQPGFQNQQNFSSYKAGYQDCVAEVSRYLATNTDLQIQPTELSQNGVCCYPVISDMTSPIPSPPLQSSAQAVIDPMYASLSSPQGNMCSQIDSLTTRAQYSPPSPPALLSYNPEPVKSTQYRYPTPPPSPSSPRTEKSKCSSTKCSSTSGASSTINTNLWRPWC